MNDHAPRAWEQWLNEDCRNFVAAFVNQAFEFSKAFDLAGRACEAHRTMRAVGGMHAQNREAKRFERRGEWRIVAHGHCANRIAVVGVFERDDAVFPGLT